MLKYRDFGAAGDGITDDMHAIVKTHEAANKQNLPVQADPNAVYFIGDHDITAVIQTPTDWNTAKFIMDDKNLKHPRQHIFHVMSKHAPIDISSLGAFKKDQLQFSQTLPYDCVAVAINDKKKQFIRHGLNPDNGTEQTDVFIIRKDGRVDETTPVLWDFDETTSFIAYPIDDEVLTITGGHFTTIANNHEAEYHYYERNIRISRSNVVIDNITHINTEEPPDHGAPYSGFVSIFNCANVSVLNSSFSAHKAYTTIGRAEKPVRMGSYDLVAGKAVNLLYKNCVQSNSITDSALWGLFGSNFTKNVTFDTVKFSRFDAHKGTVNPKIINSEIGYMGIQLIGSGDCLIENTKIYATRLVYLRDDYGSTWEGNITIKNCEFFPPEDSTHVTIINASYSGEHDFGYTCYMPETVTIDGLIIHDGIHNASYDGPVLFSRIHENYFNPDYIEAYPYVFTKKVSMNRITTTSGKIITMGGNPRFHVHNI